MKPCHAAGTEAVLVDNRQASTIRTPTTVTEVGHFRSANPGDRKNAVFYVVKHC